MEAKLPWQTETNMHSQSRYSLEGDSYKGHAKDMNKPPTEFKITFQKHRWVKAGLLDTTPRSLLVSTCLGVLVTGTFYDYHVGLAGNDSKPVNK